MTCRILYDREAHSACWFDSITMTAFGPVVHDGSRSWADEILRAAQQLIAVEAKDTDLCPEARALGLPPTDPRALSESALWDFILRAQNVLYLENA